MSELMDPGWSYLREGVELSCRPISQDFRHAVCFLDIYRIFIAHAIRDSITATKLVHPQDQFPTYSHEISKTGDRENGVSALTSVPNKTLISFFWRIQEPSQAIR